MAVCDRHCAATRPIACLGARKIAGHRIWLRSLMSGDGLDRQFGMIAISAHGRAQLSVSWAKYSQTETGRGIVAGSIDARTTRGHY